MKSSFESTYKLLYGISSPSLVNYSESQADIISPSRGFMQGFDFTMQLQVGCPGGCLYCYVPSGARIVPGSVKGKHGEEWGFQVRNKKNALNSLKWHLNQGTLADKMIYWSGITDPYAAPRQLTEALWETLLNSPVHLRPRRIVIQTRFRPDRDINLIAQYAKSTKTSDKSLPVVVSFSIGTDRDELIQAWERSTPLYEQRMKAIEILCQNEITVIPAIAPFGQWNNLGGTLETWMSWKIRHAICLFFKEKTHSANTPQRFILYLRDQYPFLLNVDWQRDQFNFVQKYLGRDQVFSGQSGFSFLSTINS